jgi:hypothetical protein
MIASGNGHTAIVETLLHHNASVDMKSKVRMIRLVT